MPDIANSTDMQAVGMPQQGAGARLFVEFHTEAVQDMEKSAKEGRPIHVDQEFITIMIPGERDHICRPVRDGDKQQFAMQYNAFKANLAQPIEGTPLEILPFLTKSMVADMKAMKIRTIEQLANLSDTAGQNLMGFHSYKRRAKDFLDAASGNAPIERLNAELAQRDSTIATLQKAIDDQGKKIEELLKNRLK